MNNFYFKLQKNGSITSCEKLKIIGLIEYMKLVILKIYQILNIISSLIITAVTIIQYINKFIFDRNINNLKINIL